MKVDVLNLDSKVVGNVELSKEVFSVEPRNDIIHSVVRWQLAKRRSGNHKTKGITEISGTGKKPWKQKGTGRARAGSLRAPQFRGGATIFGPVVRSHEFSLPKKVRKLGLRSILSDKLKSENLVVLDNLEIKSIKTKDITKSVSAFGSNKILFVGDKASSQVFKTAIGNLIGMDFIADEGLNVYDIIRKDKIVITKDAIERLESRLK